MANKWLEALKTGSDPLVLSPVDGGDSLSAEPSKNGHTPEKPLDKIDKNNSAPTKPGQKAKKKKLTPEEEAEHYEQLCREFPSYVRTEERAAEVLRWAQEVPEVAIDIETHGHLKRDGLLYTHCQVRMILLHHGGKSWFLDCEAVPDNQIRLVLAALGGKPLYLHNCMFDIPRLYRHYGVLLDRGIRDTMIASRVARAGEWERRKGMPFQISHGLDECLKRELGVEIPKDTKLKWGGLITEDHLKYTADDISHLQKLHDALERLHLKRRVSERYEAIRACLPEFVRAAVRGIPLDAERLRDALGDLEEEISDLEARLGELGPKHPEGMPWKWGNTSKEVMPDGKGRQGAMRALHNLGVEVGDLQDQTLLDHREEHPIVGVLYDYRKKTNTLARYRKWIPDFYDPGTGRLYPQPKVAAAVTGRVLYSDPNAQGIDKKRTKGFRECVRAPEGRMIVTGDFAQQELRIAAYFSKDRAMLGTFAGGEDIYLKTAEKLVGYPVNKDHPARQAAKRATLGFIYGLGPGRYRTNVYKDTGDPLSEEQAVRDRQAFRAAFPEFYRWQQRYGTTPNWETRSVLGWRRKVKPGVDFDGNVVPSYTERLNGPIQSTAGDILYLTLQKMMADPMPGTYFLLSVHDELVLECPADSAHQVALWLKEKMRSSIEEILGPDLGGPKSVEVGYGPSWGETTEEI